MTVALIVALLGLGYWVKLAKGKWTLANDNMSGLIYCKPHSPLIRVELHSGPDKTVKPILSAIEDKASLEYLDRYPLHKDMSIDKYLASLHPIDTTFVFADGSRYRTRLTIPNVPNHLLIRFPADGFWELEDSYVNDHTLDVDPRKTRDLDILFRWAKAY